MGNEIQMRVSHIYHVVADNGWSSVLNFQSVILGPPANAQAEAAACTGKRIEHVRMSGTRKLVTGSRPSCGPIEVIEFRHENCSQRTTPRYGVP
jgi:hypothetical protein